MSILGRGSSTNLPVAKKREILLKLTEKNKNYFLGKTTPGEFFALFGLMPNTSGLTPEKKMLLNEVLHLFLEIARTKSKWDLKKMFFANNETVELQMLSWMLAFLEGYDSRTVKEKIAMILGYFHASSRTCIPNVILSHLVNRIGKEKIRILNGISENEQNKRMVIKYNVVWYIYPAIADSIGCSRLLLSLSTVSMPVLKIKIINTTNFLPTVVVFLKSILEKKNVQSESTKVWCLVYLLRALGQCCCSFVDNVEEDDGDRKMEDTNPNVLWILNRHHLPELVFNVITRAFISCDSYKGDHSFKTMAAAAMSLPSLFTDKQFYADASNEMDLKTTVSFITNRMDSISSCAFCIVFYYMRVASDILVGHVMQMGLLERILLELSSHLSTFQGKWNNVPMCAYRAADVLSRLCVYGSRISLEGKENALSEKFIGGGMRTLWAMEQCLRRRMADGTDSRRKDALLEKMWDRICNCLCCLFKAYVYVCLWSQCVSLPMPICSLFFFFF